MIFIAKQKLISIAEVSHRKIFGHEMGEDMRKFVGNLGWMAFAAVIGGIFIFLTNLAAGRLLGPEEYGKYSIIISIGQLLIIPMLLGINTAAIRYIAKEREAKEKLISTAGISIIVLTIVSIVILVIFRIVLQNLFKIDNPVFLFAVIYAAALAIKYLAEAIAKGLHEFKLLSKLNIISNFFVFIAFFVVISSVPNRTFQSYAIATIIGLSIFALAIFLKNRIKIAHFDKGIFKKIMGYGIFASIGSISGFALNNIDRIVLNNYLGYSAVGLFAAYLSASSFFSGQLLQIFVDVFFPSISAAEDKRVIFSKIKKIFYIFAMPLFLLNVLATSVIIKLYGAKYEFSLEYIILFSLLGVLTFCQNVSWWFIASHGRKGIRFTSTSGIVIGFFNVLLIIFMVKLFGLLGAVLGLNITAFIILIVSLIYLQKINGKID